ERQSLRDRHGRRLSRGAAPGRDPGRRPCGGQTGGGRPRLLRLRGAGRRGRRHRLAGRPRAPAVPGVRADRRL
ncbi:MAG: hypothetical protein AVDCRST_MAG52-1146, partial [uncultured Blastococcus sp.]